jgi:hypothetical protein
MSYVLEVTSAYLEFTDFNDYLQAQVMPCLLDILQQQASENPTAKVA